ncbi:GNAT family N-acetyltransferase [Dorea acetigenes]|uniref:GNAT family N-acetyltransferase n=1 Tax=Dorea acetigenes TaxID=2981787 RepID=A0ABT2RQI1_9FIRM|nr:GNAT family N-acetyltransferase [Dorea acetigenes]MCU6687677.1 GNAT family N-acetyltransferase [Dorea acetigenes]SCJ51693.1 Predicted acetyltransferase [uncultured Clostridium sp.]
MIRYVMSEDISNILSMMEQVKEAFPGYQEIEFLEALYKAIDCKTAFLEEREGRLAGMLTFSYQEKELTFLAVVPEFRKQGVGKRLIKQMVECFEEGETVHVITFREGDQIGMAARYCYHSCGFVDDEELVVFDYPCQKMVLKVGG